MKSPINNFKNVLYSAGDVTQYYGENPALYAPLGLTGHNGVDIVRPWGEHLFACADGIICDVKDSPEGYGKHLRILENAGNGLYREWTYGHLSSIAVKIGQKVVEGQFVGQMGNTGFVVSGNTPFWKTNPYAGTHLHFGLRLLKEKENGWLYPGSDLKVEVLNYDNGMKGSIDPLMGEKEVFHRDLYLGTSGEDVSRLQVELVIRGFLSTKDFGTFGPKTFSAVRSFQKAYLLPATGYFGRLTRGKLQELMTTK